MPAMGLSSLERHLPLGPWGGLAGGDGGDWARPGLGKARSLSVFCIPSPTEPGPSSSHQLGDGNSDLASTMTDGLPHSRRANSKAGGKGQPLMFSAWAFLGNPWAQGPQQEGLQLKGFVGEIGFVLMEGEAIPHVRESQPLTGGALGDIRARGS